MPPTERHSREVALGTAVFTLRADVADRVEALRAEGFRAAARALAEEHTIGRRPPPRPAMAQGLYDADH